MTKHYTDRQMLDELLKIFNRTNGKAWDRKYLASKMEFAGIEPEGTDALQSAWKIVRQESPSEGQFVLLKRPLGDVFRARIGRRSDTLIYFPFVVSDSDCLSFHLHGDFKWMPLPE